MRGIRNTTKQTNSLMKETTLTMQSFLILPRRLLPEQKVLKNLCRVFPRMNTMSTLH